MSNNSQNMNYVKWSEDFCDRETCYFCGKKNDGDWDNRYEDGVCISCGEIWKFNEDDESYSKIKIAEK